MRGHFAAVLAALPLALPLAIGVAALASLAPQSPAISSCYGAGSHHAALVVEHGSGATVTRCVAFDTNQITGEQLLNESGVAWAGQTFGGFGTAVCSVDAEPATYATCPGKDAYWAVFSSKGGAAWQLTAVGVSGVKLSDGDALGVHYVPASGTPTPPPAPAGVCAAAGATAAAVTAGVTAADGSLRSASQSPAEAGLPSGQSRLTPEPSSAAPSGATPSGAAAAPSPAGPGSTGGGGPDPGLILAAGVSGGLLGLALLRLRRPPSGRP